VVRTPGGSLQVDDAAFANKVALLRGSFPEAPEEEVSAALLSADYNPLGAKQARRCAASGFESGSGSG